MFKELKRIWEEQVFTSSIVEEFSSMLDYSGEMLEYALKVLTTKGKAKKFEKKIYFKDQKINITEQEIRKRILIHLTTSPGGNLPACLALISITKDAERIGDYVKNIFELNTMFKDYKDGEKSFKLLFEDIGNEVLALLKTVNIAFKDSNTELALEAAQKARIISNKCEEIISDLLESNYSSTHTVVLTLGTRYMKRTALHLANIASSIFLPLPEMDYINGKFKKIRKL